MYISGEMGMGWRKKALNGKGCLGTDRGFGYSVFEMDGLGKNRL